MPRPIILKGFYVANMTGDGMVRAGFVRTGCGGVLGHSSIRVLTGYC